MLIAQALAEYGLVSAVMNVTYTLRVKLEQLIGPPGLAWIGIAAVIVFVLVRVRR